MALTRAQLLAGDSGQGTVLPGQVQAVKAGTGILIGADGTISVDGTTVTGVVRLNNITAFNNYIWPNATGTAGQFLQLGAANVLSWANSGVYVNSTQPASPVIGGLWYDCSTGTLKVYEACTTGTPQWTSTSQSGLPVLPANTAAAPAFVSGNGIIGDPYICNITTASAGTTVYVINTVTVTGLAPYQYVPIVDLNAVTNGGRFSFSNYYANSSGTLVFQTIFTDQPTSPPATSFTAAIRVGNASAYIDATINVVTAVSVTGGTIAGPAYSGNQLTYTAGVASGGTSPYTLTYQWYRDGVAIGSATGLTYTLVSGDVGKNITAKTLVTDAASQTASGTSNSIGPIAAAAATLTITSAGSIAPSSNVAVGAVLTYTTGTYTGGVPTVTASWVWKRAGVAITGTANAATYTTVTADAGQAITVTYTVTDSATPTPATANQTTTSVTPTTPFTPAVWTPTPSNGLDSNPGGQTGTYNGTSTSITTTGCVEASVNGGAYSTGTQTIANGQSLAIRWSSSGICGGAASGSTITGSVTDGTYTNSYSLALNRIPSPAIADITDSNVPLGGVTTKAIASPIAGLNSPAYVTYDAASTGTVISASTDNVSFTPLATSGTGFAVTNGQTLYIRQTVGGTPTTGYTAVIRVGDGTNTLGTYDEFTYTATTVLTAVLPTSVYNPTSGRPNATPSTTTYNDPTLGQLYGLVSAAWNGTQASTTLTPATGLLIGKNSGALGTSAITVTNSGTDTVQVAFDPTYIASLADSATASKAFTATYNSVNYTNTFSYTVDKLPVWTAPQTVTGVALSASVSTGALTVNAYNSPVVVSFANPSGASGATAMTAVSASVAGGAATPITLGTTTVTLSPGESLQVFGTVGAGNNTKYGVQVTIGSSAAQDWYVTTTAVTPSITTPAITSPANNTTNLNPASNSPAGIPLVGDTYAPLNGAGTPQTSSTWEVYKAIPIQPETSAITAVSTVTGFNITNKILNSSGTATVPDPNGSFLVVALPFFNGSTTNEAATLGGTNYTVTIGAQQTFSTPPIAGPYGTGTYSYNAGSNVANNGGVELIPQATLNSNWQNSNESFTIEGWFLRDSGATYNGTESTIFSVFQASSSNTFQTRIGNGTTDVGWTWANNGTGNTGASLAKDLTLQSYGSINPFTSWVQYQISFDGPTKTFYQSINGVLISAVMTTPSNWLGLGASGIAGGLNLGGYNGIYNGYYTPGGWWCDVRVYKGLCKYTQAFGPTQSLLTLTDSTDLAYMTAGDSVIEVGGGADAAGTINAINSSSSPYTLNVITSAGTWNTGSTVKDTTAAPVVPPAPPTTGTPDPTKYTAITGSPFTVSASPFTTVNILQAALATSSTYYARVKYATTNTTATTSSFSAWSKFGTAASFVPTPGTATSGGYFGGQINDGGIIYNLIVAPVASGQYPNSIQYKTTSSPDFPSATFENEVYGLPANLIGNSPGTYPAFGWARSLTISGYSDWYIPAKNELEILYYNLKPSTQSNYTGSGINLNAVPARATPYTAGTPAQTTSSLFQTGGAQAFSITNAYWSSSEYTGSPNNAWVQYLDNGSQSGNNKNSATFYGLARAIRREYANAPAIGSSLGGGYFAGQYVDGGVTYNLIVAPRASGQYGGNTPSGVVYKTAATGDAPSATFQNQIYGDGATTAGNDVSHTMFQWAAGLTIGGFGDWYIPALNELNILFCSLGPAFTTSSAFQTGGTEAFTSGGSTYWTSSEWEGGSPGYAYLQAFVDGLQTYSPKNTTAYARAVRRVAA